MSVRFRQLGKTLWGADLMQQKSQAERCYDFAVSLQKVWRYDEAIKELKKSMKMEPKNAKYHYRTGLIYRDMGLLKKALSQMKKAVKLDPNNAIYHHDFAELLKEAGKDRASDAEKEVAHRLGLINTSK